MPSNTLTSASNINLNTLSSYYNATLTGNSSSGIAHTSTPLAPGGSLGDTLVATGYSDTLIGGNGADSLVALGYNDFLRAGSAANTLVGSKLGGTNTVLVGNGLSKLEFAGANNTFQLSNSVAGGQSMAGGSGFIDYKTDSIVSANATLNSAQQLALAASSIVQTTLNKFDLGNTLNHGAGVLSIKNLTYLGSSGATLVGNTLNDYIQGGTGHNSLVAGAAGKSTLDGHLSSIGGTLVGNGSSTLIGGSGSDVFQIPKSGDKILEPYGQQFLSTLAGSSVSLTGALSSYNLNDSLTNGSGVLAVSNLIYNGNANSTLTGNSILSYNTLTGSYRGNSIKGGTGSDYLIAGSSYYATLDASASTLGDTLVGSSNGSDYLIGGAANNTFLVSGNNDTITAVSGSVNSIVSSASSVNLSNVVGNVAFSSLRYSGYGATTLIGSFGGGTTINAGNASGSTLGDGGGAHDTLIGSASGKNLFSVSTAGSATDSIQGGSGSDTLKLTNSGTYSDTIFLNDKGIEALQLTSNTSITLGGDAYAAGISTVIAGVGSDTLTSSATLNGGFLKGLFIDASANISNSNYTGGNGNDTLLISGSALNTSTLNGGLGYNVLELTKPTTLSGLTSHVSKFQELSLTGAANSISGIGSSGITSILGGKGGRDTIDASTATTALTINESASTLGDTLTASTLNGNTTLIGSAVAANTFNVGTSLGAAVIGGASSLGDTLSLTTVGNYTDTLFANDQSVEVLKLKAGSSVILGGDAYGAGISTVVGGGGSDTYTSSATLNGGFNKGLFINASANTSSVSFTGGNGGDTLLIGGAPLASSTLNGAGGNNILELTNAATLVGLGTHVTNFQTISLNGGLNNINGIGTSGVTSIVGGFLGLDTIDASTATAPLVINDSLSIFGDTLTASNSNSGQTTLLGSSNSANLFNVGTTGAVVNGGIGNDTLNFSAAGSYADSGFANDSSVEVLRLSGSSSVTLGGNAYAAGISTVIGGTGSDTFTSDSLGNGGFLNGLYIDASADLSSPTSFTGGVGGDTIKLANATVLNSSTINGGSGNNLLQVAASAQTIVGLGSHLSNIQELSLTGGHNNVSGVGSAGISTILGGIVGADTIDASTATTALTVNESASTLGDTLTASTLNGNSTLIGSSVAANTFNVGVLGAAVTGGIAKDTLNFSAAGSYADSVFGNDSSVEILSLTGSSAVTLGGDAYAAGISTVIGGTGSDTFISDSLDNGGFLKGLYIDASADLASPTSFTGGVGGDTIKLANATVLNSSTINGGAGTNLLQVAASAQTIVGLGSHVSNVQELSLTGGSNNVSGIGTSGITTIISGTLGGDTFDAATAASPIFINASAATHGDTLTASSVNGVSSTLIGSSKLGNNFKVASEAALVIDSLQGGAGTDTLLYSGNSLASGDFALSAGGSLDILSLNGAGHGSFSLGSDASAAGIVSVIGGTVGGDIIDGSGLNSGYLSASNALTTDTLIGGLGSTLIGSQKANNVFYLPGTGSIANDSIYGNLTGTDTLGFTNGGQTLNDAQLAGTKLTSIKVISLSGGGNDVALGVNAQAAKISQVIGGAASLGDTLSVEGYTQGNVTLDGSANTVGDTLVAGSGSSKSVLLGNNSSSATNYYQIATASLLGNDSIVGGIASADVLQLTSNGQSLPDTAFTRLASAHLDTLSLGTGNGGGEGFDSITLGAKAEAAFNADALAVTSSSLNSGNNYIDASGLSALSKLSVDLSGNPFGSNGDTILAGPGHNTLQGGIAASADNLFIFTGSSALQNSSIIGGGGTNTLQVNGNAQNLNAASFAEISEIQVLNLNGNGDHVTLSGADSAGITTIIGGTGPTTIDGSTYNNTLGSALVWNFGKSHGGDSLIGGHAVGNLFQIANAGNLSNSTIQGSLTGSVATDTIQLIAGGQTIGDAAFAHDSYIGEVILSPTLSSGTKGNWLTLGLKASQAGITSIIGGASADTIDASGLSALTNVYINGSIGTGDSLLGGAGNNTLIGASTGTNVFVLPNSTDIVTSSIVGGNSGNDTLAFNTGSLIHAGDLAGVSNIGALEFLGAGNQVTLGADALQAGITTIIGGQGNDTVGGDTLDLSAYGSAAVLIQIPDQNYMLGINGNTSSIVGSAGADTLQYTRDGVSVTEADFANIQNIQVIQTSNGNNHFLLGNAYESAGIQTIVGGLGHDTMDLSDPNYVPTRAITYNLAKNAGYSFLNTIEEIPYANIVGGSGANNMTILNNDITVQDSLFAGDYQAHIGTLVLQGGTTNAILGSDAQTAGINTLYLGLNDYNDVIDVSNFTGKLVINGDQNPNVAAFNTYRYTQGYNGGVLVQTSYGQLANLTYNAYPTSSRGTTGYDSLALIGTQARAITSDSLNGTFDALVLGDGNNFVQLTQPNSTGLSSIFGGHGSDTINVQGFTTLQGADLVVNLVNLPSDSLRGGFVYTGGKGNDTLSIVGSGIIADSFSRATSIQAVALDSLGGSSLTLGNNARNTGIHTVIGGAGGDTIDATNFVPTDWYDGNAFQIWNFDVILPNAAAFASDVITGVPDANRIRIGTQITQTVIDITSPGQFVYDSLFAAGNNTNIQGLHMDIAQADSMSGNFVTLGAAAALAGIIDFNGGSGHVSLTVLNENYLLDTTTGGLGASITGGANASKLSGYNTFSFLSDSQTFTDADFKNVSNFQKFYFNQDGIDPGSSVTFGANAQTTGFTTLIGGFGSDSITQTTADTLSLYIDVSTGSGDYLSIATAAQLALDTIKGSSSGIDTLNLGTGGVIIVDSLFGNDSNLNVLTTGGGNNSITLGSKSQGAGINDVIGGTGNDLIDATATTAAITLDGGGKAPLADTLNSGTGADTFVLGTTAKSYYATSSTSTLTGAAAPTNYAAIGNLSSIDVLQLSAVDQGNYHLGIANNAGFESTTHFGLYDGGGFVADITTNGTFTVSTLNGGAAFLASSHVTYV